MVGRVSKTLNKTHTQKMKWFSFFLSMIFFFYFLLSRVLKARTEKKLKGSGNTRDYVRKKCMRRKVFDYQHDFSIIYLDRYHVVLVSNLTMVLNDLWVVRECLFD